MTRTRAQAKAASVSEMATTQLEERMSGTTDKAKGRVKEAIGALTDDQRLKNEGKVDQAAGAGKDGVAKVVDKLKAVASPKK